MKRSDAGKTFVEEYFGRLLSNAEEAIRLQHRYRERLKKKLLRLRPNAGGLSLVSYNPETPQLGPKKGKRAMPVTAENIERLMEMPLPRSRRPTPEKRLQSALIKEASEGDGRIRSMEKIMGGAVFFITDELAFTANGKKVVLDLLLLHDKGDGKSRFVCVELKSERRFKKIAEQVGRAREFAEGNAGESGFSLLAGILLERSEPPELSNYALGTVVWPMDPTHRAGKARSWGKEAKERGLLIIGYSPDKYSLTVEFEP